MTDKDEVRNLRQRVAKLAASNKRLSADNKRLRERVRLYTLLFWEPEETLGAGPH